MSAPTSKPALLAALAAAVAVALAAGSPAGSADQPKPQPVVEQNIDPSGAIRVHEQGTAQVLATNPADKPVPVRDVENPPSTPFQQHLSLHVEGNSPLSDCADITVPLRKTLAVEHIGATVNARFFVAPGSVLLEQAANTHFLSVRTVVGSEIATYPIPLRDAGLTYTSNDVSGTVATRVWESSETMHVYANSGTIHVCLDGAVAGAGRDDLPDATAFVSISGQSSGPGLVLPPLPGP